VSRHCRGLHFQGMPGGGCCFRCRPKEEQDEHSRSGFKTIEYRSSVTRSSQCCNTEPVIWRTLSKAHKVSPTQGGCFPTPVAETRSWMVQTQILLTRLLQALQPIATWESWDWARKLRGSCALPASSKHSIDTVGLDRASNVPMLHMRQAVHHGSETG
jgi:hypothetical protein